MRDTINLIIILINAQGQVVVEVRVLTRKKLIFHFEIKSTILQNYKVSKYKFAPALALKWYPQVVSSQAKLLDIYAANQNQGGKECICSPHISRLARKKARFAEGGLPFGRAY